MCGSVAGVCPAATGPRLPAKAEPPLIQLTFFALSIALARSSSRGAHLS